MGVAKIYFFLFFLLLWGGQGGCRAEQREKKCKWHDDALNPKFRALQRVTEFHPCFRRSDFVAVTGEYIQRIPYWNEFDRQFFLVRLLFWQKQQEEAIRDQKKKSSHTKIGFFFRFCRRRRCFLLLLFLVKRKKKPKKKNDKERESKREKYVRLDLMEREKACDVIGSPFSVCCRCSCNMALSDWTQCYAQAGRQTDVVIYIKVVAVEKMDFGGLKRKKLLPVFFFFFLGCCGSSSSSCCCCFRSSRLNRGGGCRGWYLLLLSSSSRR